jgi:hypothetical protein
MGKNDTKDLEKFLKPLGEEASTLVLWLRKFVWGLYPKSNELIYNNTNDLAIGWSPTERAGHLFCSIAIWRVSKSIHFGFFYGSQIADPEKMLLGNGKLYRYILVKNKKEFPKAYMQKLLAEAFVNSMLKIKNQKEIVEGMTIVKSDTAGKKPVKKTVSKKAK